MANYYFPLLNKHVFYIALSENEVRRLYNEYLRQTKNPDFIMWCIFLERPSSSFNGLWFVYSEKPQDYIEIK